MKKIKYYFPLVIMLIGVTIFDFSCKSSKITRVPGESEVAIFCSGPDYESNKKALRFSAIGTSMDQMTSKKKALSEARAGLASQVDTKIKSVIDNYMKSTEHQNREELGLRYEGLTREVIDQNLAGTHTICEKMTKTKEGFYKTYVCIELGGPEILSSMNNKLSKDEILKIDYNYEKFKKTFEDEMGKMGN